MERGCVFVNDKGELLLCLGNDTNRIESTYLSIGHDNVDNSLLNEIHFCADRSLLYNNITWLVGWQTGEEELREIYFG